MPTYKASRLLKNPGVVLTGVFIIIIVSSDGEEVVLGYCSSMVDSFLGQSAQGAHTRGSIQPCYGVLVRMWYSISDRSTSNE
jgi:hypothetical protein